jgi:hypothetical protein
LLAYSCSCSFSRTTCSQIYFRFRSYLLRKPLLIRSTACICIIDRDWMIYRKHPIRTHQCLERQTFGTPRIYTLSPSKSIKGSNYGEFLKDKNVLFIIVNSVQVRSEIRKLAYTAICMRNVYTLI